MKEFTNWTVAHEAGFFTKTQLTSKNYFSPSRKPIIITEPDALFKSIYSGSYPLYHINKTVITGYYIKQPLSITSVNIGYSLYIINRLTKKLRENKVLYERLDNENAREIRIRQSQLYMLKRQVIMRLITENAIDIIGYHKKDSTHQIKYWNALEEEREIIMAENESENSQIYILYGLSIFKFHLPSTLNEIHQLKPLNKNEGLEVVEIQKTKININKAEELLERYLLSDKPIQHWENIDKG